MFSTHKNNDTDTALVYKAMESLLNSIPKNTDTDTILVYDGKIIRSPSRFALKANEIYEAHMNKEAVIIKRENFLKRLFAYANITNALHQYAIGSFEDSIPTLLFFNGTFSSTIEFQGKYLKNNSIYKVLSN
jgi:hypothetical protein